MKKRTMLVLLGIITLLALPAVIFAEPQQEQMGEQEQFIITRAGTGGVTIDKTDVPAFGAMEGLDGWSVSLVQAAGTDMYIFKIAPGAAEMGIHESPVPWIGYVLTGVGEMTLGDKEGNLTGAITFTPGDYLIFEPNTMHGWKNTGDAEIQLLFLTATAEE